MKHVPIKCDIQYVVSNCLASLLFPVSVREKPGLQSEHIHTLSRLARRLKTWTIPRCKWEQVSANAGSIKWQRGRCVFFFFLANGCLCWFDGWKGALSFLMCAVLLYCRMFRLIWRDRAVRQKASGPRCMVIVRQRVKERREASAQWGIWNEPLKESKER